MHPKSSITRYNFENVDFQVRFWKLETGKLFFFIFENIHYYKVEVKQTLNFDRTRQTFRIIDRIRHVNSGSTKFLFRMGISVNVTGIMVSLGQAIIFFLALCFKSEHPLLQSENYQSNKEQSPAKNFFASSHKQLSNVLNEQNYYLNPTNNLPVFLIWNLETSQKK